MKVKSEGVKKADGSWEIEPATFDHQFQKEAPAETTVDAPAGGESLEPVAGDTLVEVNEPAV